MKIRLVMGQFCGKNDKNIVEMYELNFSPVSQNVIINALPCLYVFIQTFLHLYRDRYKIYLGVPYDILCPICCQCKPVMSNVNTKLVKGRGERG